jgi:shikimate kinase
MRIILIGFMSSGKSTIGKRLAHKMNMDFIDIDEAIESKYRMSISNFFELFGENKFRELERIILLESFEHDNTIISTGGGTPCFFDNMQLINKHGISVYLKLHPNSIISRLLHTKKQRPLLKNMAADELAEYVKAQIIERAYYYQQAQFTYEVENKKPNEIYHLLKHSFNENGLIFPAFEH